MTHGDLSSNASDKLFHPTDLIVQALCAKLENHLCHRFFDHQAAKPTPSATDFQLSRLLCCLVSIIDQNTVRSDEGTFSRNTGVMGAKIIRNTPAVLSRIFTTVELF
ncbi:hypothetical protein FRB91_007218 [Serendipita sp. 411]|nr:hypothetical protein FRB91_007218 [Serendipita sp. 411]